MNNPAVEQIRAALREADVDCYVAYTPSNIRYVTGFGSYFVSEWWRMHGTVFAVVPADPGQPVSLVVSDFESATARDAAPDVEQHTYRLWVDLGTSADLSADTEPGEAPRPEQFNEAELVSALQRALRDSRGPANRVATDLPHVSLETADRLRAAAGTASLVDFTGRMYEIRSVKQPWEVEQLTRGVQLSESGMTHAARNLVEGMTARDVRLLYQLGVIEAAQRDPERYGAFTDSWVLPTVGTKTSASYGSSGAGLRVGDLVKFDCGATVSGYRSDGGRTFSFGEPSSQARGLYEVLRQAQDIACRGLRPGAALADVFKAAMHHVHSNGYPSYNRGHVGHSIGIDTFHEEPPFISATCTDTVRPGMVFAVELPSYTPDIGAIMIEDLVLTTEDEPVRLHSLTHDLVVV